MTTLAEIQRLVECAIKGDEPAAIARAIAALTTPSETALQARIAVLEGAARDYVTEIDEEHWCQRVKYGNCSTRRCLLRPDGTIPPTPIDFGQATCARWRLEQVLNEGTTSGK